jgi:hypothetical protein
MSTEASTGLRVCSRCGELADFVGRLRAPKLLLGSLLAALLLALAFATSASADVSFTRAWGWGVSDGMSQFETCTTSCRAGFFGGGAGQLDVPDGVATNSSGDVYVADANNERVDEFSATGGFIRAWGWGVSDGMSQFETCTSTCRAGIAGGGAGQLYAPWGVATDSSGDVYVGDAHNERVDEFSSTGGFIRAWGWGVSDGISQFETCTSTCQAGIPGGRAGQLYTPEGIATDSSGDVYVADHQNQRVDEFSSTGGFIRAWGWGVSDGISQFETCTSTCQGGSRGGGAGQLDYPGGVAIDGSGDVYIAGLDNERVDEFSFTGGFIRAWGWGVSDGMSQFETCTSTCRAGIAGEGAGQLDGPGGVAIDGSGDLYVADTYNERVDEFSSTGGFIGAWGWGVSDGMSQFETCTSTCRGGSVGWGAGQLDGPGGVAIDSSGDVYVVGGASGRVDQFAVGKLGPAPPPNLGPPPAPNLLSAPPPNPLSAPANIARPTISRTTKAGQRLRCSTGSWSNAPTSSGYQWIRNGTALAGATSNTYRLRILDEGTALTCLVTASNAAGSGSALSQAVKIPIPYVPRCPGATGRMTGTTIGQVQLGMTRARADYLYRRHSDRGKQYEDFFCLTPVGVRVGYATPELFTTLSEQERRQLKGRVVWASTSDPYYELDGVRPGESLADASRQLKNIEPPFHIGLNYWYLARESGYTAVLKVRGGVVEELGIAENALTRTRSAQNVLMHSFY